MDFNIMKLFEEDEDESMHSGSGAEAFMSAVNRNVGSVPSSSRPVDTDVSFSQDDVQTLSQLYSQWKPYSQDENSGNPSHQQGLRSQEQQSTEVEMKEHGSSMEIERDRSGSQEPTGPHVQLHRPVQVEGQGHSMEASFGDYTLPLMPMQPQMSTTLYVQVHEQAGTSVNRSRPVPFGSLLPIIIPELAKDKSMELLNLYGQLQRNELAKNKFVKLMRQVVGDKLLKSAVVKAVDASEVNSPGLSNQSVSTQEQASTSANREKLIPFRSLIPILTSDLDKDSSIQLKTLYKKMQRSEITKETFVRLMRQIVGDERLRLAVIKKQGKPQWGRTLSISRT